MPADTSLPEGVTLVDAFPFDSNPQLVTDVNGYLRGDRSVDAWTMQNTFRQFFTDGVFGTPANALQIAKAESGLAVTVQPGMFVIHGGMGGIKESDGPLTLTLDEGAAAGNVCYGIMLRYDNNADMRGLGLRVVKGTAGASPQPPSPDQSSENVYELRLGYVTVPNGATDLTDATVTNEKGLDVCPFAAPFAPLNLASVVSDAKQSANEALGEFEGYIDGLKGDAGKSLESMQQYIADNKELIDSALDETTAGYLQGQIDELKGSGISIDNIDTSVFNIGKVTPDGGDILRMNDGAVSNRYVADYAITNEKIADGSVTVDKLSPGMLDDFLTSSDAVDLAGDIAILRYEVNLGSLIADQSMRHVYIWEFPNDVDAGDTPYESDSKTYYVNGEV